MKKILTSLIVLTLLMGCSKDEEKSYTYWSNLVEKKQIEINNLVQSVACTDVSDFEIIAKNGYHLVHPTVKSTFEILQTELDNLLKERSKADPIKDAENLLFTHPITPIKKICENGKPKLIFPSDLSLEEINVELPLRYAEISAFYKDVPCTDANAWFIYVIRNACCLESMAIHKTIGTQELTTKINSYNRLIEAKMTLEGTTCLAPCPDRATAITCMDGKATLLKN